ncbi:putative bifunctional diguanylate cyclase/phosphodiesterase [Clostridium chrysemydis]|uniref:putative bifunctional diguanylate cyclase/phosphodiesterase n=1 Tax=Clostridium chrysemydis TaxID=2665504 RepID=UPI001883FC6D|nr:EAL domain-containing protein [Clostridium chrysemydis]
MGKRDNYLFKSKRRAFLVYLVLVFFSIILRTNWLNDSTASNLFNFSNMIYLIIIFIYGRKIGYLTSGILILFHSFFLNDNSLGLIYFGELIFIYEIYKRKKISIILIDLVCWLFIIIPVIFLCNNLIKDFQYYEFFDALLIFINSLLNTFLAEIVLRYFVFGNIFKGKLNISLKDMFIHITAAMILVPFIINIYIDIYNSYDYIYKTNEESAKGIHSLIEKSMDFWTADEILNLKMGNIVEVTKIKKDINRVVEERNITIYISDEKGHLILGTGKKVNGKAIVNKVSEHSYKITIDDGNKNKIGYNLNDNYILYKDKIENGNLDIYISTPMNTYRDRIVQEQISQIKFLILFIFFIGLYLIVLNKTLFKSATAISENTRNLPYKLKNNEVVNWPKSGIYEVNSFISNMETMSEEMRKIFKKLNKSQHKLYKLAYYDNLTNLRNRLSFRNKVTEYVKGNEEFSIMLLDIDKFKSINDTLGHNAGDELLVEVSKRLKEIKDSITKVYRIGGDEFVVLVKSGDEEIISNKSLKIIEGFKRDVKVNEILLNINCSMGVSIYPKDSKNIDDIIKFADIAMYESKAKGYGKLEFFNITMKEKIDRRVLIENNLTEAIKNNKLKLFMQPKIYKDGKSIAGFECLLRWTDEELGVVYPDEFISVAEESNLIISLDEWVIKEGLKINKNLQDKNILFVPVSINISGKHFTKDYLIDSVKRNLKKYNIDPKYLKLEVTESVLIEDTKKAIENMEKLKSIGVKISMDDFGKGYSSLTQLIRLPIEELKVDREFIKEVNKDVRKKNIVKLIVNTAKELGLNIVAEGVENDDEKKYVIDSGCDEVQGYFYSKPLPEEEFIKYLKERAKYE